MIKLFLGIFRSLYGIFRNIFNMFFWPRKLAARPWRSTETVDRVPEPVDRVGRPTCTDLRTFGQTLGRSTGQRALLSGNFGSKKLFWKPQSNGGIYSPKTKLAVRLNSQPETAGGRPPGRPAQSTGQTCTDLYTSVDRPVDRLWNTVDRPGRPPKPGSQISGSEKHVKNISKNSYKSSKNPQK